MEGGRGPGRGGEGAYLKSPKPLASRLPTMNITQGFKYGPQFLFHTPFIHSIYIYIYKGTTKQNELRVRVGGLGFRV